MNTAALLMALFLSLKDADTFVIAWRVAEVPGKSPTQAVWLEQVMRLDGLDTPESFRPQCPEEKALAEQAKHRITELFKDDPRAWVVVSPHAEKFGRALLDLYTYDKVNVRKDLIARGLAREYHGEKKQGWCQ